MACSCHRTVPVSGGGFFRAGLPGKHGRGFAGVLQGEYVQGAAPSSETCRRRSVGRALSSSTRSPRANVGAAAGSAPPPVRENLARQGVGRMIVAHTAGRVPCMQSQIHPGRTVVQQHQPHPAIGPHQRRGVPGNQRRGLPGGQLRGGGDKGAAISSSTAMARRFITGIPGPAATGRGQGWPSCPTLPST